jgi:hypothetical protein
MPTEIRSDDAALRPSRLNAICDPFWIRGPKDGCFAFQLFEDYGSTNSHNLLYHGTTQCRVVPLPSTAAEGRRASTVVTSAIGLIWRAEVPLGIQRERRSMMRPGCAI